MRLDLHVSCTRLAIPAILVLSALACIYQLSHQSIHSVMQQSVDGRIVV